MTSAGPAPSWCAPPAAAVPMVAKIPAPTMAPMPSAISWSGPRARFIWCSGSSASARMTSSDFLRKSWLIAKVRRRISEGLRPAGRSGGAAAEPFRQLREARDALRHVAMLAAPVEEERRETGRPRAVVVVAQRVADVQRLGRSDAETRARPVEDLGAGLARLLDCRHRDRAKV